MKHHETPTHHDIIIGEVPTNRRIIRFYNPLEGESLAIISVNPQTGEIFPASASIDEINDARNFLIKETLQ